MTSDQKYARLALLMGMVAAWPLTGLAAAGLVQFAAGDVQLRRGETLSRLSKGAELDGGDVVLTGTEGRAQIRFSDGGLVALYPDSQFTVTRYADGAGAGEDHFVVNLLRGGDARPHGAHRQTQSRQLQGGHTDGGGGHPGFRFLTGHRCQRPGVRLRGAGRDRGLHPGGLCGCDGGRGRAGGLRPGLACLYPYPCVVAGAPGSDTLTGGRPAGCAGAPRLCLHRSGAGPCARSTAARSRAAASARAPTTSHGYTTARYSSAARPDTDYATATHAAYGTAGDNGTAACHDGATAADGAAAYRVHPGPADHPAPATSAATACHQVAERGLNTPPTRACVGGGLTFRACKTPGSGPKPPVGHRCSETG